MRRIAILLLLCSAVWAMAAEQLNLNKCTVEELRALPLTETQVNAIYQRLLYEGPFNSLYDLADLPEIDSQTLLTLRPLLRVDPPRPSDDRAQRIEDAYYRIENLGTEEGTNVGLVDEWIDRLLEPMNVNDATLDELLDLQNVSPADAVAIYNQVKTQGAIRGARDLRSIPGLSDWGYRNARNYVGYEALSASKRLHGNYTFRAYNTPFFTDEELAIDPAALIDPRPDVSHKLRVNYDRDYKAGVLWHRNLAEKTFYANEGSFKIPEHKWFASVERKDYKGAHLGRAIIGDYQVSLGQGVSMESGDYFSPRYSGFGFDKRITGIASDLSRAREFTMSGLAYEGTLSKFKSVGFYSNRRKDAVLNPDGSMNRLITLIPRTDEDLYPSEYIIENGDTVTIPAFDGNQSMINAVREVALGSELAYRPWTGTSLSLIATQFMYDRELRPEFGREYFYEAVTSTGTDTVVRAFPVILPSERDEIADNEINSEILNGYHSTTGSTLWGNSKSTRRVFGINVMTVIKNYTWQVEFSELERTGSWGKVGDDPHALVTSLHAQWNSLSVLALYRDYGIAYDNPYSRGFANYTRYNGTTYEDEFYLQLPVLAQLERNSAAPQAERGVYFESRYQVSRPLVIDGEADNWTRVADGADYYRWVAKITYRPVWPVLLRVRQKLQGRWNNDPLRETGFKTYESRVTLDFRLSSFDNLSILYASGYTQFTPRPRLGGDADPTGESPLDGQGASPTEAIGALVTHNFSNNLRLRASWMIYDGFFWNFEDTDFTVVDGKSTRWWAAISNRLSDQLAVRFKLTGDSNSPDTWVQARRNNSYPTAPIPGHEYFGDNATKQSLSFRIQVDYLF